MAETPIGTTKENFVTSIKTKEGGSLSFAYSNKDIVANTVGHVLAIPSIHIPLLTLGNIFESPKPELVNNLKERWKDVPWKGDVLVRVGHTSVIGDLQRLLASYEDVKGKPIFSTTAKPIDVAARFLYVPIQVLKSSFAKIVRQDYYDSITNTVNVFHPNLAIGMHEVGHAQFLDEKKKKEGWVFFYSWPVIRSFMEFKASAKAMQHFKDDTERRKAIKVLEPAWATYLVPDVLSLAGVGSVFRGTEIFWGSLISGHLMARLYPRKDERFGYVFAGKGDKRVTEQLGEPKVSAKPTGESHKATSVRAPERRIYDLKPHQILEAKARAFDSGGDRNGKRPLHSNTSRVTF